MGTDIRWFDREMHRRYATENFLVAGCAGSGKTTIITMMLRSVFEQDAPFRSLIFDPKSELLPTVFSLAGDTERSVETATSRVKVLNPFDSRCSAWAVCRDIDGPLSANQLAEILVPVGKDDKDGKFYDEAVRSLVAGLALSFIECVPNKNSWTFRDLVLAVMYEPLTRFMLEMDITRDDRPFPVASQLRRDFLDGDPRTVGNVRATIGAKFRNFPVIASCWHAAEKAGRTFSLTEWAKDGSQQVLVVGADDAAKETIETINKAIFRRASELLLARRENTDEERADGREQSYIFLDEVRHAGHLDKLNELLTKGRSRGLSVILGFQDIDGLRHVYSRELANELCAQCNNITILRLNSGESAQWASDLFGKRLGESHGESRGHDTEGKENRSHDRRWEERPYVQTAEFLYLPKAGKELGLSGFAKSPDVDPEIHSLRVTLNWNSEVAPYLPSVPVSASNSWLAARCERPISDHSLLPWDDDDWKRLGFTCPIPDWRDSALLGNDDDKDTPAPPPQPKPPTSGGGIPKL
jgi:type IV secretory pathway TraG/TraD family ATPase VirD4